MTDETGARVAPAAPSAQLTEQVSVLMTEDMRAFLLGSVEADAARGEGAVARALLEEAISEFAARDGNAMELRMSLGHRELARRASLRESGGA